MTTPEDLPDTDPIAEIRERWAKATPGPWSWRWGYKADHKHSDLVHVHDPMLHPHNVLKTTEDWPPTPADAEAIAAAPADFSVLLAEVDNLRAELAELRAEKADACTQLGCQAIDRTNEAEAHAHKLEEAIRRAVRLANDAIVRMREANRQVEAEAGRPSTMRPFVFADELVAALRPVAPDTEPIEHINGERRDCPACQVEADDARRESGGEG